MKLSPNFSYNELTRSQTATRHEIDNTPKASQFRNMVYLSQMLEEVRKLLGVPLRVTSGFRCLELNRRIGSGDKSKHVLGRAADIVPIGMTPSEAFKILKNSHVGFSRIILEFPNSPTGGWLHVEVEDFGERVPKTFMLAQKVDGKTKYSRVA